MRALFLIPLLLAACSSSRPAPPESRAEFEAELARLSDRIDAAIGEAEADELGQCRVVEVGVKPCGGPWEYRVFSMTDGEPQRVLELVAAYNARNAEMNDRFEIASTCEYIEPPEVVLENGRCQAAPR